MATHERGKIRIAWVETDAPPPVVEQEAPMQETPVVDDEAERASIEASGERVGSIALWVGACVAFCAVEGWVLPAFTEMFREVGVNLPWLTEAVLGRTGLIYGIGVLSLLHAAAIAPKAETREHLRVAAFLAIALSVGLTLYGLFLPMISFQKL